MEIKPLKLAGTFEIIPKVIGDARGYFTETYVEKIFAESGLQTAWAQENQSLSARRGTLRGLHLQAPPFAQTKLVRAVAGEILDVFVDIRKNSPTFGQWDSVRLSGENCCSVYIPHGFAHGFVTLAENSIVQYKVDNIYSREHERGIFWNDPSIGINWETDDPFLSDKDLQLPVFKDFVSPF